jgi:ADP-heptose:LPS heptosyltransferase
MAGFLVMMPHHPGDVLMALPVAMMLARVYPDHPIDFLVSPECASLLQSHPCLRKVWEVDIKGISTDLAQGSETQLLSRQRTLFQDLPADGYFLSLNLFQGRACAWIQGWISAQRKAGRRQREGGDDCVDGRVGEHLFALPVERQANPFHTTDLYLAMAREALGHPLFPPLSPFANSPTPRLPPISTSRPIPYSRFGVVHPGSAHSGKRWPDTHWKSCLQEGNRQTWKMPYLTLPCGSRASVSSRLSAGTASCPAATSAAADMLSAFGRETLPVSIRPPCK